MGREEMKEYHLATKQELERAQIVENGILMADRFINRNYLMNLSEYPVVSLSDEERSRNKLRLYQIKKLVYDKNENTNDKLISVYSALQEIDSAAVLILVGEKEKVTYYLGVQASENVSTAGKILEKSFLGNFPGSTLKNLKNSEIETVMEQITASEYMNTPKNVSSVTVVPSVRDEDKEKFVQGLEKFIDTMQGEAYTAFFLAQPVSKLALQARKRGLEELYSLLSPLQKTSLAYGENESKAITEGVFENFSHSVNDSISNTTGTNVSTNVSHTRGFNFGANAGGGGIGGSSGTSTSTTTGSSSGYSFSRSETHGTADTTGTGTNSSDTETIGSSKTLTIEQQNKTVVALLENIERQLKRMDACEAFGVWECAGYFISDDVQTSVVAANTYKALMLGEETSVENAFVNVWGIRKQEQTKQVLEYMRYAKHPIIEVTGETGYQSQYVTPGNFISGKELPLLMGLPQKSVTGVTVSHMAEFGRNVFVQNVREEKESEKILLGQIYHMGREEETKVELDLNSFTSHCFITGSTGSGKSNTTYVLLEQFYKKQIPFLVVEPAKGEYKTAFGNIPGINIFTSNPMIGQMLKINPFRFHPEIHVLEHLDRLIEIFNACWEMYAAMPAILKDAMERIYVEKGWDLLNSVYLGKGEASYPTFQDLLHMLPQVIRTSGYSSDTQGDYTGALVTRVASLTKGITGQVFCDAYDISDEVLFEENTIVDLSRVGSMETKSLIMGLLVLKLSEYRMAKADGANQKLRHITVLEEAHNLLKRTSTEQGQNSANLIGKSVEMICNSIAEMRTYGEGFVIVDQSPTAVDISAIKNTNTKILMRLPEKSDCEAVGNSVGLEEEQIKELAKLETGTAVVMQNNWLQAVLSKVTFFSNAYEKKTSSLSYEEMRMAKGHITYEFMRQCVKEQKMNVERLLEVVDSQVLPEEKKREYHTYMQYVAEHLAKQRDIRFICTVLLDFLGCRSLFEAVEGMLRTEKEGDEIRYQKDSVETWHRMIAEKLQAYAEFPKDFYWGLTQYLIYGKSLEPTKVHYADIYDMLYEIK